MQYVIAMVTVADVAAERTKAANARPNPGKKKFSSMVGEWI